RFVAARPRLLGLGEDLPDVVEDAGVGRRVGARRAADRRLVDVDDLVDLRQAVDPVVRAGAQFRLVEAVGDRGVERLVDQRRLARAGYPGDAAEDAERNVDGDVLEVVFAGAAHDQLAFRPPPFLRHLDLFLSRGVLPGEGVGVLGALWRRPRPDDVATVLAGPGAEVDQMVG